MTKSQFIEQAAIQYAVIGKLAAADAWEKARDLAGAGGSHQWDATATVAASRPPTTEQFRPYTGPLPTTLPPYGKAKGEPIAGADRTDLHYYAAGCKRTLADPAKARFHDKERAMLAAIEAELANPSAPPDDPPEPEQRAQVAAPDDEIAF